MEASTIRNHAWLGWQRSLYAVVTLSGGGGRRRCWSRCWRGAANDTNADIDQLLQSGAVRVNRGIPSVKILH